MVKGPAMLGRIAFSLTTLGFVFAAACGGGDSGTSGNDSGGSNGSSGGGGGVGSPCSSDDQCTGYDHPACLDELKPLENLVEDTDAAANMALRDLTLPFPGGYCANHLEQSCQTDANCGDDGACYRPFEGVPDENIQNLNNLGLPFDVTQFAEVGLCLEPCSSDSDCRTDDGYTCIIPITAFMEVINPEYDKTYCMKDIDVSYLLQ